MYSNNQVNIKFLKTKHIFHFNVESKINIVYIQARIYTHTHCVYNSVIQVIKSNLVCQSDSESLITAKRTFKRLIVTF